MQHRNWKLDWSESKQILVNTIDQSSVTVNEITALIWSLCDGDRTISEIEENLTTLFPNDNNQAITDFREILSDFNERELLNGDFFHKTLAATPKGRKKKLCIGMATHDDYDGVYFSVQAIRMYHPEVTDETEIIVLDNDPEGKCAHALKHLENSIKNYRYVPYDYKKSTSVRDILFTEANAGHVMCIDSHVFIVPGAIQNLIEYFDSNQDSSDLYQGPLLYDNLKKISTHMNPVWWDGLYGQWGLDERGSDASGHPFEIPMQGLALFACRKDAWLGFNPRFMGFGGEEGYIHEKFRQAGRKTLCLPFLRWMHRFDKPFGVTYPTEWETRIRNYMIGFDELNLDQQPILDYYSEHIGEKFAETAYSDAKREIANPFHYFDAIYCINVDSDSRRWAEMVGRFSLLRIENRVVRFSAIETTNNHHIGCALSHREIIRQSKYQGFENVLVFEDDALFRNDLPNRLQLSLAELKTVDWNLFYLGGYQRGSDDRKIEGLSYLQSAKSLTSTHAIAYSYRIYDTILNDIPENYRGAEVWLKSEYGIDQYLTNSIDQGYLCNPPVATQIEILEGEDELARERFE